MNETAFIEASEALMMAVEKAILNADLDVDCDRSGNVLTLESDDGQQVVINRHVATQQMWLASRQGGMHFSWIDDRWFSQRDALDFWQALNQALTYICQEPVTVNAPGS